MKKLQNELTAPRKLVPTLSERIDWAITRAMSADRDRRPNSCREFVEDLTGHSTRRVTVPMDTGSSAADVWYLVYKDDKGTIHTVKGSTNAIRRSLRDGMLGDASNIRAARTKAGPFESLRGHAEFRDIMVAAAPVNVAAAASTMGALPPNPSNSDGQPTGIPPTTNTPVEASIPAVPPVTPSSRVKPVTRVNPKVIATSLVAKEEPKIDFNDAALPPEPSVEWVKWFFLAVVAAAGCAAAWWLVTAGH
jgi:hypothetical protein